MDKRQKVSAQPAVWLTVQLAVQNPAASFHAVWIFGWVPVSSFQIQILSLAADYTLPLPEEKTYAHVGLFRLADLSLHARKSIITLDFEINSTAKSRK